MANPFRAALAFQNRPPTMSGGTAYLGAAHSRLTSDWIFASLLSADQAIEYDLRSLRDRARELVRNNDTAHRYIGLVDEQAIGHQGIRLQAHVTRADGMVDSGINQRIEDAWAEWCEPGNCTVDGRMSWVDVLANWARGTPQDGEWLVRRLPFRGNRFGYALQILDPDQLDHEHKRAPGESGAEIRMGVEIDRWARPLAYHVWDHHPAEYGARGRSRQRIPAQQLAGGMSIGGVTHYYRADRPGQTRGVPWFTSALFKLRQLAAYEEAEVVAARIGASQGGFFSPPAESIPDPDAPNARAQNQISFEIEPGKFDRLPPGWTFQAFDPKHPTDAFADFHKAMVRGIASGLDVAYVSLANDLEGVNFSSIRAGLLNERDAWRRLQWSVIRSFCCLVYREWLYWSLTTGALQLPQRNVERWYKHRWQPRGFPWVDPEKDLQAAALGVRMGVNSLTRVAGEQGLDFEELLLERAFEIRLARELKVPISTNVSKAASGEDAGNADDDAAAEAYTDHPAVVRMLAGSRALAAANPARAAELAELADSMNGNGRH